jgi:hypothetical protein
MTDTGASRPSLPGRRSWWWTGLAALVVLAIAVGIGVYRYERHTPHGLAGEAVVTASSTWPGTSARDLVTSGSVSTPGAAWQSDNQTAGAWVDFKWRSPHQLHRLVVVQGSLEEPGAAGGFLTFGDGSFVQFRMSTTSRVTEIAFSPRSVDQVRLTVSTVRPGATSVVLAEVLVVTEPGPADVVRDDEPDGNAAAAAALSQSPEAGASDPRALTDGTGAMDPPNIGELWSTGQPQGTWVQFDWPQPRELVSVAIVGAPRSSARIRELTVSFDDGVPLTVGAVVTDPTRPTVLSFMPRVTRTVRLTVASVDGAGSLALAEVRLFQRGAQPSRPAGPGTPQPPRPADCPPRSGSAAVGLLIRCPLTGDVVRTPSVNLDVSAAGHAQITATAWSADAAQPAGPSVSVETDSAGAAVVPVDVSRIPPGPFAVKVEAKSPGRAPSTTLLTLYRGTVDPAKHVSSAVPANGRTLVYADEFDGPLSVSRSGAGADYAAGKPTHSGVEDFGDAIFADPALKLGNLAVVDNAYLRVAVRPNPPGFADPQGWGRTRTGGLLAGARQGGSGFSAQYGYFEARMLVSAGPGTWPAFWLLPSDNLIRPQPAVAEIDAVELYGHEPTGACHSTHEFQGGKDGGIARCGRRWPDERTALAWHTYGVSITPTEIVFSIDGREVATSPQVSGGDAPMFFLLDLALGGGWPVALESVQDRAVLYVDHVRVYV